MTIASAITNAQNKVAAAYTALSNKGATLPATQDLSNMPSCINSIKSAEFYNVATNGYPFIDRVTGEATNFSSDNYLTIGKIDLTTADSWEMVGCFYVTDVNKYQFWYQNPIAIGLDNTNHLHIWSLPDGDIYSAVDFRPKNVYWIKVEFTGTQYNAYMKIAKDDEWQQIISTNSTNKVTNTSAPTYIGLNPNNTSEYLYGTVLLSEFYIKVDGDIVWKPSGMPTSSVIGNLTESNGAFSGFSATDYIEANYVYSALNTDTVDIQVHFKTPATNFTNFENLIMLTSNWFKGITVSVMPNNEGFSWMYNTEHMSANTTLQTNTEYWVKISAQGEKHPLSGETLISLYLSTDGSTWTKISNDALMSSSRSTVPVRVGKHEGTPAADFEGQIYRDGTLIKINNNIVWSM